MDKRERLYKEIKALDESDVEEILNFIQRLRKNRNPAAINLKGNQRQSGENYKSDKFFYNIEWEIQNFVQDMGERILKKFLNRIAQSVKDRLPEDMEILQNLDENKLRKILESLISRFKSR